MITRLFRSRKRLDSADPGERRAAVAALSDEEARAAGTELAALARGDPDPDVRRAALARLTEPVLLAPLLDDPEHCSAAARQVVQLIEHGRAGELADHPAVLIARLTQSPSSDLFARISTLTDVHLLAEAVIAAPRAHKAAIMDLPPFQRTVVLQELERRSRDHDKTTNRQARERLDAIRERRSAATGLVTQIGERLSLLEKPTADTSTTEARRREALTESTARDLARLAELDRALTAAGEPLAGLTALKERHAALPVAPAPTQVAVTEPAAMPAVPAGGARPGTELPEQDFGALAAEFEALDAAFATVSSFDDLARDRQALTDIWLARADHEAPSAAQHAVFERVSHRFHELAEAHERLKAVVLPSLATPDLPEQLAGDTPTAAWQAAERLTQALGRAGRLLNGVCWPTWAAEPESITAARQAMSEAEGRLSRWQVEVEGRLGEIESGLAALDAHIDAGELKEARTAATEVRRLLKPLPGRLTRTLTRTLARSQARLGELSDWQTFATSPKREALLAAMTELADHPLLPKDQAGRIKALRAEWNTLGPPGRAHDHRLMEHFNATAERAFEPCRAYFAEQAGARAQNLAARAAICESLAAYLAATDWQQADYRAAEQIMRVARQEWRRCHPVDRTPGKAVEARFEALQDELHSHIKAEWDRNLATKRAIVAEAEALADSDVDHRQKTETAKALQRRWKTVGVTPRRPDQTLWRAFRAACDRIFSARDDAAKRVEAQVQTSQSEAERLLAGFRARLDDPGSTLTEKDLKAFQTAFEALPPLPDRLRRPIERAYDELIRAARLAFRDRRRAEERRRLLALKTQDAEVSAMEARARAGEPVSFELPDPLFAGRGGAGEPVSVETLTRLTIEAEIAAGLESPESELRMAIQVALMNEGRGREVLEADPEPLTARWCEAGPKDAGADPLRDRFFRAIEKLTAR